MGNEMYYFYRCRKCLAVITRLQMQKAMRASAELCACGSGMCGPTNPVGIEWLRLPVLKMVLMKLLGLLDRAPEPSMAPPVPQGVRSVLPLSASELWQEDQDE
jgi:hypothetical protein